MIKIAFATDDLTTISAHLGRAKKYLVVSVENGQVVAREERDKPAHHAHEDRHEHGHEQHGGHFHQNLLQPINDCQIVVARGMGRPAFESIQAASLQAILTERHTIDEALQAYLAGTLEHRPERVH
ncbi:MAG: NifB/NifX family molybdenum-iron cluster-binding protein [Chloroflexota bacterium]